MVVTKSKMKRKVKINQAGIRILGTYFYVTLKHKSFFLPACDEENWWIFLKILTWTWKKTSKCLAKTSKSLASSNCSRLRNLWSEPSYWWLADLKTSESAFCHLYRAGAEILGNQQFSDCIWFSLEAKQEKKKAGLCLSEIQLTWVHASKFTWVHDLDLIFTYLKKWSYDGNCIDLSLWLISTSDLKWLRCARFERKRILLL